MALLLGASSRVFGVEIEQFPALSEFMQEMQTRQGFVERDLRQWFEAAEIKEEIIDAITRPREALPWHRYKTGFVNEKLAREGAAYWRAHARVLARASDTYKVAPEVILAIVGVETHFGRHLGRYRVLDALTTLVVHYPPRAPFFRRELEQLLLLAREMRRDPLSFKGSYAGAMGIGQFMPSSYRAYGVDFDGDDVADLSASVADALGSVANYFKQHGWRDGEPIYAALTNTLAYRVGTHTGGDGASPLPALRAEAGAEVIELAGEQGPIFRLAYPNFGTILRYNKSHHYAMAVAELSELIRAEYASDKLSPPKRSAVKRDRQKPLAHANRSNDEPRLGPPHVSPPR